MEFQRVSDDYLKIFHLPFKDISNYINEVETKI